MSAAWVVFVRVLQVYRHAPTLMLITLAAPIGMMLLFGFVFGGSLAGDQDAAAYRSSLIPGVLVLVAAMGLVATASSVNADLRSGLTDRFRSLPISPAAVPAGLAAAETFVGSVALALMTAMGVLVGWRIEGSPAEAALAVALLLLVRLVLSWLGVLLGAVVGNEQVLQQVAPLIFGFVMMSNVFTPTELMPSGVRAVAEWNPVSAVVAALRRLFGGAVPADDAALPLQYPVAATLIWCVGLLVVVVPPAVRAFSSPGRVRAGS